MSQCYRVELKASVSRIVKGEDSIRYPIELTQILPEDEMADLLRDQLKAAGWTAGNDEESIFSTRGEAGETLTIDLVSMELTATIEVEKEISGEVRATGSSDSRRTARAEAENLLKEQESALGDELEDTGNRDLQAEVTNQLSESEETRQRNMHELLQRVYAEALKRKAGQLGEIMEITESTGEDGNYELTIRIEQ